MSRSRTGAELLPILATAFPHTFFVDPAQVQPLKIDIHLDLLAALPAEIKPIEAKRFLHAEILFLIETLEKHSAPHPAQAS